MPRACIHRSYDRYDRIECSRRMRLERRLPSAQRRLLARQRAEFERIIVPLQDEERNRLLEEILYELRELRGRR